MDDGCCIINLYFVDNILIQDFFNSYFDYPSISLEFIDQNNLKSLCIIASNSFYYYYFDILNTSFKLFNLK